jgi:uncharacterized protein (DUF1684 family)
MKFLKLCPLFIFVIFVSSCGKDYSPKQKQYIAGIEKIRKEKNQEMKSDTSSPFNIDSAAQFHDLNYFTVDPNFVFKSKLFKYLTQDTITIYGTKGEPRKVIKYGYVKINFKDGERNVNVYKGLTKSGGQYYSIWFTDKTTNKETYGVGRYLDFNLNPDTNFIYTIDFNLAYNPYCSYSAKYSCAIPTKDDFIDEEITAGEKKFHN